MRSWPAGVSAAGWRSSGRLGPYEGKGKGKGTGLSKGKGDDSELGGKGFGKGKGKGSELGGGKGLGKGLGKGDDDSELGGSKGLGKGKGTGDDSELGGEGIGCEGDVGSEPSIFDPANRGPDVDVGHVTVMGPAMSGGGRRLESVTEEEAREALRQAIRDAFLAVGRIIHWTNQVIGMDQL